MDAYVAEIRKLENKFSGLEIHHVIRDNNVAAMSYQNLVPTEQRSLQGSSSMSGITLQSTLLSVFNRLPTEGYT
jgi:hypothetical protein